MSLFPAHRKAGTDFLPTEGRLPPFEGASGWLGSEPLTPQGLQGRIVAAAGHSLANISRSDGILSVLFGEPQRRFESRLREGKIEVRSP